MYKTAVRMRFFRADSTNIMLSVIQALAFAPDSLQFRSGFIANSVFESFRLGFDIRLTHFRDFRGGRF